MAAARHASPARPSTPPTTAPAMEPELIASGAPQSDGDGVLATTSDMPLEDVATVVADGKS